MRSSSLFNVAMQELQMKEQALMTKMKTKEQQVEEMKKELEQKEKTLSGMMDELQLQLQEIAKERSKVRSTYNINGQFIVMPSRKFLLLE